MDGSPTLRQLLIETLPPGFAAQLFTQIAGIYPESHAAVFNNPSLGEAQASYVLGFYRRGLAETVLTRAAVQHGLGVMEVQPDNGGCKHVYIRAGRFGFTMSHVPTPGGFPQHSDAREQSSQINDLVAQGQLFPIDPQSGREDIYGVFVHTERTGHKDIFQSLCIGFPNPDFDGWIEDPIDIQEIIDVQRRLFHSQEDLQSQVQTADPTWKRHAKSRTKTNDGETS